MLSGFFSAAETSLMSLSKIRMRHLVEENVKGADIVSNLIEKPNKLLGTILVGNNIVNIGASALATSLAITYFGDKGIGIATGIMTFLVLIFGEITPKSLATQNAEKISLKVGKIIYYLTIVLNPIITVLIYITDFIIRIFGGKIQKQQPFITEEELKTMVNVSHEEGVLEEEEKQMIYNVFQFGDSQVKDAMTPKINMVAVDINSTYEDLINVFREEQFSRLPVYEDNYDNIVGFIYIKDLMLFERDKNNFDLRDLIRQPFFTYEFKGVSDLFTDMRAKRTSMAIVLDEYGVTSGLITIEDLVEEIVGDIGDEYDEEKEEIEIITEDEYVVDGSVKIDVVNDMIGANLESEDFDSIGGFIIGILGRLPNNGETLEYNNIQFIIENIEKNRIEKLRIHT